MNWDKILNQNFAIRVLEKHFKKNRLATVYLLTGQEPAKLDIALAFASALNCEKKRIFETCDCSSCSRVERGHYPDIKIFKAEEAKTIKIEEIRNLLNWVHLKPYEGVWKVFIAEDADRLTPAAANALLKTLEEPPSNTIFLLLAESRSHLLETIQSRSFEIRLKSSEPESQSAVQEIKSKVAQIKNQNWDELLEPYHSREREEVKEFFSDLMHYFRDRIYDSAETQDAGSQGYLDAIQAIYETREALEANVNQKIALSRLSMKLMKGLSG